MEYTVVSGGTERANIMGMKNTPSKFPKQLGYCGVGIVIKAGENVCDIKKGDRVLVYHGTHSKYNIRGREEITKIDNPDIESLHAAFVIIASMGLAETVKKLTFGKGINGCVEVTGNSKAMLSALECASYMGRISLLGCTRVSDSAVDYYNQVHRPGIKLIRAHNFVRPKFESYPHHWTHHDDCRAILQLISAGRINVEKLIGRVCGPEDCGEIYSELCDSENFPLGTVFDWRDTI